MKPYWAILTARFRVLLQYRAAAVAGFGTQLFWGLIRMMIFTAFYENATASAPMSLEHVVTYIWLAQAFFALIPIRGDAELAGMIRTGNVAYELLRPVDLYNFWFSRSIALRVAPTVLRATPMLIVASLAGWIRWDEPASVAACAAGLLGAVLLSSAISTLMVITMCWTISGHGVNSLIAISTFLLSGMIVPLPLFPDALQPVLNALPFRGLCDVPYRLFTGHIPVRELPYALAHQLGWVAGLVLLGRWLLGRATRRLVIQGG